MEFDSQLLQDLLDFLRTLEGVSLPVKFQNLRGQLLGRVRTALSAASNYMDMQPGKPLKFDNIVADDSSEEYVVSDQQPHTLACASTSFLHQLKNKNADNIDTELQPRPPPARPPAAKALILESPDPLPHPQSGQNVLQLPVIATEEDPGINLHLAEDSDEQLEIYNNMGLTIAEAKAHYSGKLQRREKWLVFENIRPFWAALVDHHLLTYDNRSDQKPTQILSMKGCTCKPVATSQRNVKKFAESTFELTFEDNRNYQFIASAPKEMEQWVAKIIRCKPKPLDQKNANIVPLPVPQIEEEEASSDNSNSNDYYDDLVIENIAEALATPQKALKLNASRSPMGQRIEPKTSPKLSETKPRIASPTYPKLFNRVLPSLPPSNATIPAEQEDEMYQDISEHVQTSQSNRIGGNESLNSIRDSEGALEEVYDDIDVVREEAKKIEDNMMRKNSPLQENSIDDQETYDDVDVIRKEVNALRRNDGIPKESTEIESEKKTLSPPPALPTKPSPMKNFLDRLRQKSESPEKVGAKKKPAVPLPQQLPNKQTPKERQIDRSPAVETADISNYNSLPHPRPVKTEKSISGNVEDEDGEEIYDDVVNKNHMINLKTALEKRKENDNSTRDGTHVVSSQSTKIQRNVSRNLNKSFEGEIYENRSGVGNDEDELEHYQVPRADANAHALTSSEDDDSDKIYDDVAIVVQKKREIEESKQKPVVKTPPKFTQGPAVMAKPSANKLFNKFNKFPLSVADKSPTEKNNQNRFIAGKKPKTQEANIPLRKRQLTFNDEELYDDCLTK